MTERAAGPAWSSSCGGTGHGPGVSQLFPAQEGPAGVGEPSSASRWCYGKGDIGVASTPKPRSDQHRGTVSKGKLGYIALLLAEEAPESPGWDRWG